FRSGVRRVRLGFRSLDARAARSMPDGLARVARGLTVGRAGGRRRTRGGVPSFLDRRKRLAWFQPNFPRPSDRARSRGSHAPALSCSESSNGHSSVLFVQSPKSSQTRWPFGTADRRLFGPFSSRHGG